MNYPVFEFRGSALVTEEEARILHDIVSENKPKKLVELGTFGGYATTYLAHAVEQNHNEGKFVSVDFKRDLSPSAEVSLMIADHLKNVTLISKETNDGVLAEFYRESEDADVIFVDDFHAELDSVWSKLKGVVKDGCVIIFHDVNCETNNEMKVGDVFSSIDGEKQIHNTVDPNGFDNGIGVVKVSGKKVKETITPVAPPAPPPEPAPIVEEVIVEDKVEEPIIEDEVEESFNLTRVEEKEVVEEKIVEKKKPAKKAKKAASKKSAPKDEAKKE
jgi:predicted O-methyltransferase YrrM